MLKFSYLARITRENDHSNHLFLLQHPATVVQNGYVIEPSRGWGHKINGGVESNFSRFHAAVTCEKLPDRVRNAEVAVDIGATGESKDRAGSRTAYS